MESATTLQPEPASERRPKLMRLKSKIKSKKAHAEKHSAYGDIIRDVIIGFADGLTVPFALTAGLSSYVCSSLFIALLSAHSVSLGSAKLVIIGGLAELFSGAISMGLGAYLAAVTERDHYICEENREREEVATKPNDEKEEIYEIMKAYGVGREATTPLVNQLANNTDEWIRVCHILLSSRQIFLLSFHTAF